MRDAQYGRMCFKSGFSILSCEKCLGFRPRPFSQLRMIHWEIMNQAIFRLNAVRFYHDLLVYFSSINCMNTCEQLLFQYK